MATRLYFTQTAATVSPIFDDEWSDTGQALRRVLSPTKGSSTLTVGTQLTQWTGHRFALDRQYITPALQGDQLISGSVKGQVMVREYADADDINQILVCGKVVSGDGATIRGFLTLAWHGNGGIEGLQSGLEFINNATHRNHAIAIAGSNFNPVQGFDGDHIVWEIGYRSDAAGAVSGASAKWGENSTDLPENFTQTSDGNGWIEFSQNLIFQGGSTSPQPTYFLRQRFRGVDNDFPITLTGSQALYVAPFLQPETTADVQGMEVGARRGPEGPGKDIQVDEAGVMIEVFRLAAPVATVIELKKRSHFQWGG